MTSVGVITQARTTSTRLPGKVLLTAAGKTFLEHHLSRLKDSGLPVFVATTTNPSDDEIVHIASRLGARVHRGSEFDVLSRFNDCAQAFALDVIVRVTSDCPLIDGTLIASAAADYLSRNDPWLYMSNTIERSYPRGFDLEVFSAQALTLAAERARKPSHREHVTPYLYSSIDARMHLGTIDSGKDWSFLRVTLDTTDDLALLRTLIEEYEASSLSCDEIIALLDGHPELVAFNAHVEQKRLEQ